MLRELLLLLVDLCRLLPYSLLLCFVIPVGPYRTEFRDMTNAYYKVDYQHVLSHFTTDSSTVKPMTYQMNMDSIYVEQVIA